MYPGATCVCTLRLPVFAHRDYLFFVPGDYMYLYTGTTYSLYPETTCICTQRLTAFEAIWSGATLLVTFLSPLFPVLVNRKPVVHFS